MYSVSSSWKAEASGVTDTVQLSSEKRRGEEKRLSPVIEGDLAASAQDSFLLNYRDEHLLNELGTHTWMPDPASLWNAGSQPQPQAWLYSVPVQSSASCASAHVGQSQPTENALQHQYTGAYYQHGQYNSVTHFNAENRQFKTHDKAISQTSQDHRNAYQSQIRLSSLSQHFGGDSQRFFLSPTPNHPHHQKTLYQPGRNTWRQPVYDLARESLTKTVPRSSFSAQGPSELVLDWSTSDQPAQSFLGDNHSSSPASLSKRKYSPAQPGSKKPRPTPQSELELGVVIFETSPGALATVKHRRRLDAPVRKAAKDVRKAGACHQCRFRKRTCSLGTPCGLCLKTGNGLHELKCQRESPFVGKRMYQYFEHSSTRRVVSFDVSLPLDSFSAQEPEFVTIDGVGHLSYPIRLRARSKPFDSFSAEVQATIRLTEGSKKAPTSHDGNLLVTIIEDAEQLGNQLEQWALEYTSKFVHAAGPAFHSTTMAQILGTAYVKKGLPESPLVATMLRVASLAFILRAGVKPTTTYAQPPPRFRTVQARVDTILYQRLKVAEKDLCQMLQRLIFRSAGSLNRQQVYPVALVLYQLMRILCIGASHLTNIAQRFQPKAGGSADYQFLSLKLVLSTHLALFRSSNPLLVDFNDQFNHDLLDHDKELLKLAGIMRNVVITFQEKGFPDLKGSIVWRKEFFEMFRRVYDGL